MKSSVVEYKAAALFREQYLRAAGRCIVSENGIALFWTGSAAEFAVTGSELSLHLFVPEDCLCPWVCIYLNDHLLQRCLLRRGSQTLTVYDHLNFSELKYVKIMKDSPALLQNAVYGGESFFCVSAVETDGSFSAYTPDERLKIELIGDSITSGEGLFGYPGLITEDLWFFTAQPQLHYGTMTAAALHADLRMVTQAGWGVYIGYINDPSYNVPSVYGQVCGVLTGPSARSFGARDPYDFLSWQPDVIIVNLGTNDAAAFVNPGYTDPETGAFWKMRTGEDGTPCREDLEKIRLAALAFLRTLRERSPKAFIIWCYGMMGHDIEPTLMQAVKDFDDPKAIYVSLPDTQPGEFGAVDHPGPASHKKTADVLTSAIKKCL